MRLVTNLELSYHLLPLTAAAAKAHEGPHQLMWLHPDDASAVAEPLLSARGGGWPEGGPLAGPGPGGRQAQPAAGSRRVSRTLAPQPSRLSSLLSFSGFHPS